MPNKAVFLDRDHTLIEDPGYLADAGAVKLLPGVETAMKSLAASGYKIVVVTNQSGVARGLLTVETLEAVHAELKRQLAERGVHLDAVYYCPFHPEGTVEGYIQDSDLRKPKPGMLLKAAAEMDIDLSKSWMVGDKARDVEAGLRASCRTIRLRQNVQPFPGEVDDEDIQADYTVKNLVEAARIILYEADGLPKTAVEPVPAETAPAAPLQSAPRGGTGKKESSSTSEKPARTTDEEQHTRREILRYVRQMAQAEEDEFSFTKLIAGIVQVFAIISLALALWKMLGDQNTAAAMWAQVATALQVMALTFFLMNRSR
jgi:D,D-heptose 1,7-bisphosphate phosphatase